MALRTSLIGGIGLVVATLGAAAPAAAHIELLEPASRYTGTENKSCPCGAGSSNRTCDVAADGSDPARSANVTTFEVGSTIVVRFNEYVDHSGRFRIAFDPDGADVADFNANILLDEPDPAAITSNTADGTWEFEVTLPDTPCENCTLQLIQVMNGDTENPVLDPSAESTYYACADLTLVPVGELTTSGAGGSSAVSTADATSGDASATTGMAGSTGSTTTSTASDTSGATGTTGGAMGTTGSATGTTGSPASSTGSAETTTGGMGGTSSVASSTTGAPMAAGDSGDQGGCACRLGATQPRSVVGWVGPWLALVLLRLRREKRPHRARAG